MITALRSLAGPYSSQHWFAVCQVAARHCKINLGLVGSDEQVHKFSARCIGEIPNLILETSWYREREREREREPGGKGGLLMTSRV